MFAGREDQRSVFASLKNPLAERRERKREGGKSVPYLFPFELHPEISSYLLNKCVYCRVPATVCSYLSKRADKVGMDAPAYLQCWKMCDDCLINRLRYRYRSLTEVRKSRFVSEGWSSGLLYDDWKIFGRQSGPISDIVRWELSVVMELRYTRREKALDIYIYFLFFLFPDFAPSRNVLLYIFAR